MHQIRNRHIEPVLLAQPLQIIGPALAPCAKAEIGPDSDMGHAQARRQHIAGEVFGGHRGKGCIEGQLKKILDPQHLEAVRAGLRVHEPERWLILARCLREESARMGLEGDDPERLRRHMAEALAQLARQFYHRAVAAMHPVKIAHRNGSATCLRRDIAPIGKALHMSAFVGGPADQSNLREGARTRASPFKTTVSPTAQWVSRVTRRREWSIAMTLTSA